MGRPTDPDRVRSIQVGPDGIACELKEAPIDRLALDFCSVLDAQGIRYAIVGGYVAILLGRPRESDDVDIISRPLDAAEFAALHSSLLETFESLTPGSADLVFREHLEAGRESTAVRYSAPDTFVPNIEFKFARKALDHQGVRRRIPAVPNGHRVFVGPVEMQVAFKLFMGAPKDYEDPRWIARVAEGWLDESEVWRVSESLGVPQAKGRQVLGIG